jgi:hypothetical protein
MSGTEETAAPPKSSDPNWGDMAKRLDQLATEFEAAAPHCPHSLDDQLMLLWSRSLQHYAIQLRQIEDGSALSEN